jgi:hypothetical protein
MERKLCMVATAEGQITAEARPSDERSPGQESGPTSHKV